MIQGPVYDSGSRVQHRIQGPLVGLLPGAGVQLVPSPLLRLGVPLWTWPGDIHVSRSRRDAAYYYYYYCCCCDYSASCS